MSAIPKPETNEILNEQKNLLQRQASILKAEQEASIDAILVVNESRRIVSFNRRFCEIFAIPTDMAARCDDDEVLPYVTRQIKDFEAFLETVNYLYTHPDEVHRGSLALEDGRFLDRYSSPIRSEEGEYFGRIWFFRDDTERRHTAAQLEHQVQQVRLYSQELEAQKLELEEANAQLAEVNQFLTELATTDGLTGLKNHRAFQERLSEEFARSLRYHTPLSLIILDLDNFKSLNDLFGHPAGDAVLRQIALLMQREARLSDITARYGGEEFALILPETSADDAFTVAERMRHTVESATWEHRQITASFGIATLNPSIYDHSALIAQADAALYRSKQRGRNCVTHCGVFTEQSNYRS